MRPFSSIDRGITAALAISIGMMLLVASVFGTYYEEYQALFHALLSGKMSPGVAFESWYYQGYIGLAYLYSKLYGLVPQVEWLGWISYTFMAGSGALLVFLFGKGLDKELPMAMALLLQVAFAFLMLSDHVVNLLGARIVFLTCGSSMLAIIILFSGKGTIRRHPIALFLLHAVFILGALSRSEPALAAGLLLTCFSVVWNRHLLRGLAVAFPALLIAMAVVVGIMVDINTSDKFHKQVEPDIEMQFTMRKNVVPISAMADARDSLRYEAAMRMVWGDPRVISVEFMRGMIANPSYSSWDIGQWRRTCRILMEFVQMYPHLIVFNAALLLLIFGRAIAQGQIVGALLTLLYAFGFAVAVAVQTYFVKMTTWSFSPFLTLFTASLILLFLKEGGLSDRVGRMAACLVLLFGIITHGRYVDAAAQGLHNERTSRERAYQQTLETVGGGTLLITPSSFQHFLSVTRPLEVFDRSGLDRLYIFESQILSLLPGYRDYLEKECSCDVSHFPNFYHHLMGDKGRGPIYTLTTPDRAELISRYLLGIHGYRLLLCPVSDTTMEITGRSGQTTQLALYILEEDSCTILHKEGKAEHGSD